LYTGKRNQIKAYKPMVKRPQIVTFSLHQV